MQRDEYIQRSKNELDQLSEEVEKIEAKIQQAPEDFKDKYKQQLIAIRQHRQNSQNYLQAVSHADENSWESLRNQAEHTWQVFRDSVQYYNARLCLTEQAPINAGVMSTTGQAGWVTSLNEGCLAQ